MVTGFASGPMAGLVNREMEDMKAVYTIYLTSAFVSWHASCAT